LAAGAKEWRRTTTGVDGKAVAVGGDEDPEVVVERDGYRSVELGLLSRDETVKLKKVEPTKVVVRWDPTAPPMPDVKRMSVHVRGRRENDASQKDRDGPHGRGHPLHGRFDMKTIRPGDAATFTIRHPATYEVSYWSDDFGSAPLGTIVVSEDSADFEFTPSPDPKRWDGFNDDGDD
jgi:hypothetical protein